MKINTKQKINALCILSQTTLIEKNILKNIDCICMDTNTLCLCYLNVKKNFE